MFVSLRMVFVFVWLYCFVIHKGVVPSMSVILFHTLKKSIIKKCLMSPDKEI